MSTERNRTSLPVVLAVVVLVLSACTPTSAPAPMEAAETTATLEPEPTATVSPTEAPTETPSPMPTDTPPPPPPTATPDVTLGWSSHASSKTELSFRHPGEWFGPAELGNNEGAYVKDPEADYGLVVRFWPGDDPDRLLAEWASDGIHIDFVLDAAAESSEEGDAVVISRLEAPTRVVHGGDITAQAAFVRRPRDVMEVMWFAPTDAWEEMQDVFAEMLDSIDIWEKHVEQGLGLQTMFLHDWADPVVSAGGMRYRTVNGGTGLAIWTEDPRNVQELLADWTPDDLGDTLGLSECTAGAPGPRLGALGGEWDTRMGACVSEASIDTSYVVTYLADRDRALQVVGYGPTDEWDGVLEIVGIMLAMLIDIR
ncbi:MAG: hypothetical protein GX620_15780 [Chloroflexi bacterium]|nr:hypothetical protein [Chloroflexota bacterium]